MVVLRLDWFDVAHPLALVFSEDPFRERILGFSSLDSDFPKQADFSPGILQPYRTKEALWPGRGNFIFNFSSYKKRIFSINIFTSETRTSLFWAFLLKILSRFKRQLDLYHMYEFV